MQADPREYSIVDAHCHIYPAKIADKAAQSIGRFYRLPARCHGGVEELLSCGSPYGVRRYLVCSAATTPEQVHDINGFIAGCCEAHPEYYGYGTLHPDCDVAAESARIPALGLHGIKLHPDFQRFAIDAPTLYPVYEEMSARGLPILFHIGDDRGDGSSPLRLNRVLDDFPRLRVIAAHLGAYHVWEQPRDFLRRENVWFDCSSTIALIGAEEAARQIRRLGVERIFFGSDFPLWSYGEELTRFFELPLTRSEREAILGGNFLRFSGLTL